MPWQVSKKLVRHRGEQVADVRCRRPSSLTVVDHDRENRRVYTGGAEIVLVESPQNTDGVIHPLAARGCVVRAWLEGLRRSMGG